MLFNFLLIGLSYEHKMTEKKRSKTSYNISLF